MKTAKRTQMSDYKKDIVDLIGIDFEATPVDGLKLILNEAADFLPKLLDKSIKMSPKEVDELLNIEQALMDKEIEEAEKALARIEQLKTCESFVANYWRRRYGEIACNFRCSLGSNLSKRLASPVITKEGEQEIIKSMKNYFPFNMLDDETMKLVVVAMSKLNVDAGEFLYKKDDFTDKFYYVQSGLFGTVVVRSEKCIVSKYFRPGECVGNENILFGSFYTNTIKCLTAATVWVLDSKTLHSVCHWGLKETHAFLELSLSKTPGLEEDEGMRLVNALVQKVVENNVDVLAVTPRSALYIVLKGKVLVKEINVRGDIYTRKCGPGDVFGQDRLFSKRFTRLNSAVSLSKATLYYLKEDAFHRLFDVLELYKKSDIEPYQDNLFYRTL